MGVIWDDWQKDFLNTEGSKILCCGRQVGKTEICAKDACDYALKAENRGKTILMIAPTERQARHLFTKTLNYLVNNANLMIKMGKDRPTKSKIELKNKVIIYCLPAGASGTGIRGLTCHRIYVDEASQVGDDVFDAVSPMILATGGDLILLSTPFGAQGVFYETFINKDNAYNDFTKFSVTSEVVMKERPIRGSWTEKHREKALAYLDTEKKRKSKRAYSQEYLGNFESDLFRYFNDDLIKDSCVLTRNEHNSKQYDYYLGVDIARMGEDDSSFQILRKVDNNRIIHIDSIITRKTLTTETTKTILNLHERYDFEKIGIDAGSGSLGVGIFDHLLDDDRTKRVVEAINNRARSLDRNTNQKSRLLKEDLYDNLRSLMERGIIRLLNDDEVIASLRSIQYEYIAKEGQQTKLRIYGDYSHIVEGLIRAAILAKEKTLNIWVKSIRV